MEINCTTSEWDADLCTRKSASRSGRTAKNETGRAFLSSTPESLRAKNGMAK
jgi:hypothetical protein